MAEVAIIDSSKQWDRLLLELSYMASYAVDEPPKNQLRGHSGLPLNLLDSLYYGI